MKPLVKHSEKSRVLKTSDYSIFTMPDMRISTKHLNVIKESLTEKNLSQDFPILVDEQYNIIEGKYRFLACYDLKIPVFYKVSEVTTLKDAIRIKHIHKNITVEDVINVYIDLPVYNNLLLLANEFGIDTYFVILCTQQCLHNKGINRKLFQSGGMPNWDMDKTRNAISSMLYLSDKFKYSLWEAYRIIFWDSDNYEDNDEGDTIPLTIAEIIDRSQLLIAAKKITTERYTYGRWRQKDNAQKYFYLKDLLRHSTYPEWQFDSSEIEDLKSVGVKLKGK